jgi:NCAIR mutase (PurE)-related protein
VDRDAARELLAGVASGAIRPETALDRLVGDPYEDLGFAKIDTHRALRTGDPEVVYGAGKSPEQCAAILAALHRAHPERAVLLTRADESARAAVRAAIPGIIEDAQAGCVAAGPLPDPRGRVAIVSAGTSDGRIAAEAAFVARAAGANTERIDDVGVAGLHRVLAARPALDRADCVVVVAGMDGALPSVIGGLIGVPLVAVPTSVGYGAAFGGIAALLTMLNSCAPGVAVVNIDNGFGAGLFAARVARRSASAAGGPGTTRPEEGTTRAEDGTMRADGST